MGKVKNMAWDEAENYLDKLIKQIKNKTMTIAEAVADAKSQTYMNFDLVGIHSWDDLEECLTMETQ